ncbi:MAG: hypothetical protein MUE74_05420 [Bacteroidales bacterium]|nr:hypothetical protein [Bacteroidales bacterium]
MSKTDTSDEIDLLDLFKRMGRTISKWLDSAGRAFTATLVFLIRNIFLLALSVALGIGLSYLMKWVSKPFYVSEITLRSNAVPNSEMIEHFNKLNKLLEEKDFTQVNNALSFTAGEDPGLIDLEAFWVIDRNNDSIPDLVDYHKRQNVYDTIDVRMQDRFVVRVRFRDKNALPGIRNGIFTYADNNRVFQEKNAVRLRQYDEMLVRLNYDIRQLDSLQKVKYFEETRNRIPENGGQMIFLQEQRTQLVYDNIHSLFREKQTIEMEKSLYSGVLTLISDFYTPGKRFNGGFYYGIYIIPAALTLMLAYLIMIRNRKKIREVFRKY